MGVMIYNFTRYCQALLAMRLGSGKHSSVSTMAYILVHLKPPEMTFHVHINKLKLSVPIEMVQLKVYEIMFIVTHISVTDAKAVPLVLSKELPS